MSVFVFALALGGTPTQGSRIAVHGADDAAWGRSCDSLQNRFTNQGARLKELEGKRQFISSISVMRTLRRANARKCDWVMSGEVDVSAVMQVATSSLSKAPCYDQARAAAQAALNLSEEAARDAALNEAAVLLLSDDCAADVPDPGELDASDDELEEEMDDTTDEIMEAAAGESDGGNSLLQEKWGAWNPLTGWGMLAALGEWAGGGWILAIAAILVGLVLGLLCKGLVHLIVRIFRWIRCSIFGRSCSLYKPATWVKRLVKVGCNIGGILWGPHGLWLGSLGVAHGYVGVQQAIR